MSAQPTASQRGTRWMGALAAAIGLYFTLVGLGALPLPGGPRNLHGPLWLVLCCGLAFLLAGIAVLIQTIGHADDDGNLPAEAPQWMRVAQYLIVVAIFTCFAAMATWVAFGGGPREFSGTFMFFGGGANAAIGRAAFGFGAIICWLCTLAMAVVGARKLLGRGKI